MGVVSLLMMACGMRAIKVTRRILQHPFDSPEILGVLPPPLLPGGTWKVEGCEVVRGRWSWLWLWFVVCWRFGGRRCRRSCHHRHRRCCRWRCFRRRCCDCSSSVSGFCRCCCPCPAMTSAGQADIGRYIMRQKAAGLGYCEPFCMTLCTSG